MISSHDLWLTNARFSNDEKEITHGYDIACDVIKEVIKAAPPSEKKRLSALLELIDPKTPDDVYICCFCTAGDRLGQWRGYGADGTGVSIAFNPSKFSWATGGDMRLGVMRFWKVYYERDEQEKMIRDIIMFGRERLDPRVQGWAQKVADIVKFFIPTFKHRDFGEEEEWRLIFTPGKQDHLPETARVPLSFRVARQMLVPYYSLRMLIDKTTLATHRWISRFFPLTKSCWARVHERPTTRTARECSSMPTATRSIRCLRRG